MIGTHWPGGFAEFVHIPEFVLKRGYLHHIPEGVSMDEACLSEPASSVIAGMERAGFGLGDTILILGDGPIGCLHIEAARALGAAKIIISGNLRRQESLKRFKPDYILDASREDVPERVKEITGGLGVDLAICANPVTATQEEAVQSVRKRGRVVLFGGVPKTDPMTTLNSNTIHYNEIEVVGAFSYETRHHLKALEAIRTGALSPELYFTKTVSLDDINEGFRSAKTGKALKILVKP
jgi:L-iditol 2-dehydrogenase